ncbi:MAG: anaerobic ribonucleoside-triphosphate reductase [Candidatus Helarchaeota archaeon]
MSESKVSTILKNISGEIKIKILKFLSQKAEPQSFTNIMQFLKMDPSTDAGKFGYHLKMLKDNKVIEGGAERGYRLTGLGEKVVDVIWDLSDTAIKKEIKVRTSDYSIIKFDRGRIAKALIKEANMPRDKAEEIAKETEEKLLNANINYLTAPLIREAVNYILLEKGLENYRHQLTRLGLPPFDVRELINKPVLLYDSDHIKKVAGNSILEQFLFLNVLEFKISDAHLSGEIFIPNADNFILIPNSIQHDARIFLKNGLPNIFSNAISPPKSLNAALQLLSKIFNEMSNAKEQCFDCFNTFLAPYIKGLNDQEVRRALREFVEYLGASSLLFNKSLSFDLEVPKFLSDEIAIGTNQDAKTKYEDYYLDSIRILELMLDILKEGDSKRHPFLMPNCFFKLKQEYYGKSELETSIQGLEELICENGTPFLINLDAEKDGANINQTSFLDTLLSDWKETEIDTLRTGNLDWVIVNLPRIAIDADNDDDKFFDLLKKRILVASDAMLTKRKELEKRFNIKNSLELLAMKIQGENYYRLENSTCTLAFLGLKEAIKIHKNTKLIDSIDFVMQILNEFNAQVEGIKRENNIRFQIKQAPFNSKWSSNLFQLDRKKFELIHPKQKGKWEFTHYDGSFFDTDLELSSRIEFMSKISSKVNGYLMTIPTKSKLNVEEIKKMNKTILDTNIKFFGYGFPYTFCASCNIRIEGSPQKCHSCGASENRLIFYRRNNGAYYY